MSKQAKIQSESMRAPIVSILGHVDHGKTTILDSIRHANVQAREVGGITQKISSFTIDAKGKKITFIDTPGHEAFDLMRVRGGNIADIVLLIVAADDGVKPQTKESIDIINNSSAKPIVVINKVDLPNIDLEKVKREIANNGLLIEGVGGKVPVVEVSGKTGKGIDDLLDMILLVADLEGLKEEDVLPKGVIGKAFTLESVKEKSRGNVCSVVVTQGEFSRGTVIGYKHGNSYHIEKIKGIISEDGEQISTMQSGFGGRILGLSQLIELGNQVYALEKNDEKLLKSLFVVPEAVPSEVSEETVDGEALPDMSFLFGNVKTEDVKTLKVIIKSSSEGSLEAIKKSLEAIESDGNKVEIIHSGAGDISQSDIVMAEVSKAIILGFEVSVDQGLMQIAREKKVLIRTYDIIYKLIEEIGDVVASMSEPEEAEEEIGQAEVRAIFTLTNGSQVIGCRVKQGVIKRGSKCYIVRGDEIIGEGRIDSLRTQKETINEAKDKQEFGAILDKKVDAQVGDALYCYKIVK